MNLTRFSLFFSEKREFFLEGQGIFAFGGTGGGFQWGSGADTPIMFFSRRIGIAGADTTPIRAGARLTGRAGKYTIGLLNIQTGEKESVAQATNFSVARLRRDIFSRSNVGMIFTNRSVALAGNGSNQLFGADANFAFYQNLLINAYYAETRTESLESRNDRSYLTKIENNGDRYGAQFQHLMVGGAFNPEVGFVRRRDFRRNFASAYFSPRPASIESVRKFKFGVEADFFHNLSGLLETRELSTDFRIEFESGDSSSIEYTSSFELLDFPFEIVDDVIIPIGTYEFDRIRASYELGTQRRASGRLSLETGGFFGGDRTEARYEGRIEVTPQLSVEPGVSVNWVDLPQGTFATQLVRARVNYTLSPRMFVSGLVQYNSDSHSMSVNARFRWEYEPGSDLYLVYSDGRDTRLGGFPSLLNRGLVVKFTKLMRF